MSEVHKTTLRDRFRNAINAFRGKPIGSIQFGIDIRKDVLYLCDRKACGDKCSPECKHTTDIHHAKNFEVGMGGHGWWEKEYLMLCRKKPIVVEAFTLGVDYIPDWFMDKVTANEIILRKDEFNRTSADIRTLEGWMHARYSDIIIKGVAGEIYPCKPDIFWATYEVVPTEKGEENVPS